MSESFEGESDDGGTFDGSSLVELCERRARERGEARAFTWLRNGEVEDASWSFAELDRRARRVARELDARGLRGQRALLLYSPGLEFLAGFLGCLYAGVVAVPLNTPRHERSARTIAEIVRDAAPVIRLTDRATAGAPWVRLPFLASLPSLATDALRAGGEAFWRPRDIGADTLAFLQYTSGSTGRPRGVELDHRNLLRNEEMIRRAFGNDEHKRYVSWLPLFHDMGLIGNVLQPLYLGVHCVLMSPVDFVQKPVRWLRAMSRYRATTTGGPNFGYELCVRRVTDAQVAELDLSHWELAFNGAEPVRAETLRAFEEKFSPAGFRPRVFCPCYGLAEATLFVTGAAFDRPPVVLDFDARELARDVARVALAPPAPTRAESGSPAGTEVWQLPGAMAVGADRVARDEAQRARDDGSLEPDASMGGDRGARTRTLVGCGRPRLDLRLAIVDSRTRRECAPGRVGEIWLSGSTISRGYRGTRAGDATPFAARLDGVAGEFLRTGDLGFVHDGELFVTGRSKDVLIQCGQNHYPQDLERAAADLDAAFRAGGGAAFGVAVGAGAVVAVDGAAVDGAAVDGAGGGDGRRGAGVGSRDGTVGAGTVGSVGHVERVGRVGRIGGVRALGASSIGGLGVADERIVLVQEVARTERATLESSSETACARRAHWAAAIRAEIAAAFGVHVWRVCFVRPGAVPKTSSGKVRRARCRELFLDGSFGPGELPFAPARAVREGASVPNGGERARRSMRDEPRGEASVGESSIARAAEGRSRARADRDVHSAAPTRDPASVAAPASVPTPTRAMAPARTDTRARPSARVSHPDPDERARDAALDSASIRTPDPERTASCRPPVP